MGRRKLGETTALRITLPPDASPDMIDLFKKIKSKETPMAVMRFLYELSLGQKSKMQQEVIEDEDDFDDFLSDFMPS